MRIFVSLMIPGLPSSGWLTMIKRTEWFVKGGLHLDMKIWNRILIICSLFFCILFPVSVCQAQEVKEYYVILDNTTAYPVTAQQYEQVQQIWDDRSGEQILELLRQIFGADKVPSAIRSISLRVYTYTKKDEDTSDSSSVGAQKEPGPVDNSNPDFDIIAGRLMSYRGSGTIVTIPETVTSISQGAFYSKNTVKKVVVPGSVKIIESYAFYRCEHLRYIVFAGKAQTVGNNMVYQCDRLTSIVAPAGSKESRFAEKKGIRVFRNDRPTFGQRTMRQMKGNSDRLVLYNNPYGIQWHSSRKSVVSVSSSGKIKCHKKGSATITAAVNGKNYPLTISVDDKSEDKRVEQIIQMTIKKGMSTRQKVKAVHDWLIKNVKYDYYNYLRGTVPRVSHMAKGALLRGIAVCDGYSEAFQKIMKELGIPCKVIIGEAQGGGHAWNKVKVGGKWRYVDVTFDDPVVNGQNTNTKPYYMYFLKTAGQMRKDHLW